ncbi:MAG: AAA family ATPase, partial [Candidatus Marinimicrobia bacterium]|nr:AAA family ATPase [Candidatus Neomarinimicrobiota bacterium]
MLKSISFKNYKSFRRKTNLEIKPLTILVGPNNAGKTSITDLFALFKQSTSGNYEPNSFFVLNGKDGIKGPLNRIINYKSMIEGVESKPMEIKIDLD